MLDKRDTYRAVSLLQRPQQLMTTVLLMLSFGMSRVKVLKFSMSLEEQMEAGGSGMYGKRRRRGGEREWDVGDVNRSGGDVMVSDMYIE
jgi:hypothetical protein